jgi:hypothetical protein
MESRVNFTSVQQVIISVVWIELNVLPLKLVFHCRGVELHIVGTNQIAHSLEHSSLLLTKSIQ